MNILISGCSFTHWPEEPGSDQNICWPAYLCDYREDLNITNKAEPAAGNQYVGDSIVNAVIREKFDHVIAMWSGVSRLDYLTGLDDPDWKKLFDSYGFYRRMDSCPESLGYIFSGGKMGTWYGNNVAYKMFYEMYKVSSDSSLAHINLMEIIKTQNFLENKNIPYHFMSYVNYWTRAPEVSPNGDFGVLALPELQTLIAEIDWSRWIFLNDQKDGLYELAKSNNDFQEDGFHPGVNTHRQWAEIVADAL